MFRHTIHPLALFLTLLVPVVQAAPSLDVSARRGDVEALRASISAGADINARFDIGRSALMIAANAGKPLAVEILANAGADLNLQDNNGDTALHLAAVEGHQQVVAKLLASGADYRIKNRSQLTALDNVEKINGRYGTDPKLSAVASYLARTIPTLPPPKSKTGMSGGAPATTANSWGEPALNVSYVTTNVGKYKTTPETLQQVAKAALIKRGWTILKSDTTSSIGSYTRKDIEYRTEIRPLPDNKVRIAFLNGYQNTNPGYLENLEKEIVMELELRSIR